jgi:hypothetical protein
MIDKMDDAMCDGNSLERTQSVRIYSLFGGIWRRAPPGLSAMPDRFYAAGPRRRARFAAFLPSPDFRKARGRNAHDSHVISVLCTARRHYAMPAL